ncbi:MAG: DNA polymerase Y family protein [Colwellia sp.]|nr:DNA polymerase Y family protein [Colwellia sp.]
MTLWLYLHFPVLQLDTLYSAQQDQPIIIVEAKKNAIVQFNKAAAVHGVKLGMGLGTASSLCDDLHVHPYQAAVEKEKLLEIAHWLYLKTSDISFFEPNGILLRVSNMLTLYDGLDNYWQALKVHLTLLKIHFYYATAYSPLAAQLLAQSGFNQVIDNKKTLLNAIKQHSLVKTTLPSKTIEKLNRTGVRNLKELLNIPLAEIAKRFDISLVNFVGRLTGNFQHPVNYYTPPVQFKRCLQLLFDIENAQWLERPLNLLLNKLESFLTLGDKVTHEIIITLHQRDTPDVDLTISSARGDSAAKKWLKLSSLTLESIKIEAPVHSITLCASRVVARHIAEVDLFSGYQGNTSPLELLSILQAKLGKQAIKGLAITEDARPELSSQFCEPLSNAINLSLKGKLRPSLLLPTPQRLTDKVSVIQGPERIATGWWDGQPIVRDYFIARSKQGRWLWIFKDQKKGWFLHGAFS